MRDSIVCHLGHHRRFPSKIIGWKNWIQKSLNSKDKRNSTKTKKTQLSRTERPVGGQEPTKEIEKDILFGHEDIKRSTRTVRPVGGLRIHTKLRVDAYKNWRRRSNKNGRPVGGQESTKVEELDIDFRVPGLSHAVVKEAEHFRVQELVKKIESHPHREALQADLQQNNVYNPFSNKLEGDDPRIGQCRVIRVVRNFTKGTMFSLSSLLESRNCVSALADNSWLTANPEESLTN